MERNGWINVAKHREETTHDEEFSMRQIEKKNWRFGSLRTTIFVNNFLSFVRSQPHKAHTRFYFMPSICSLAHFYYDLSKTLTLDRGNWFVAVLVVVGIVLNDIICQMQKNVSEITKSHSSSWKDSFDSEIFSADSIVDLHAFSTSRIGKWKSGKDDSAH